MTDSPFVIPSGQDMIVGAFNEIDVCIFNIYNSDTYGMQYVLTKRRDRIRTCDVIDCPFIMLVNGQIIGNESILI